MVSNSHNSQDLEGDDGAVPGEAFETIYALLQAISPSYQHNFQDAVTRKLQNLDSSGGDN